jgi:hypothetical protein
MSVVTNDRTGAELAEIYNLYRSAALNKDYYGALLSRYQVYNTTLEILIAVGATSSGISGLTVWQLGYGKAVWATITLVSGLLAVVKPFLQLNKQIERYSRLFTGHLDNYLAIGSIVTKIRRRQELTPEMLQQFEAAEQRYIELSREDDPSPVPSIHKRCDDAVRLAHPDESFWYPPPVQHQRPPKRKSKQPPPAGIPQDTSLVRLPRPQSDEPSVDVPSLTARTR